MEKSLFAQIGGTYEQQGDYMIPYFDLSSNITYCVYVYPC